MWIRTLTGLLIGLILTASIAIALVLVMPSRQVGLLMAILSGFILWAGFQTWVYCTPSLKRVMRWSVPVLLTTMVLNAWLIVGGPS